MNRIVNSLTVLLLVACASSCGGGNDDSAGFTQSDAPATTLDPQSETATYSLFVENFWSAKDFPQGYPSDAHLSFFGGAVHNQAVSFWSFGDPPSPGITDMAETGRIDILLEEVAEAIANGTADSSVDVRIYTNQPSDEQPGELTFSIQVTQSHPLVTFTSMLGPSPDWFVGVNELSLLKDNQWLPALQVDLPLYDAGTRSNMTPVMHGPSIRPPDPISYVAYDQTTGVYLPTEDPQNVARVTFTRSE